VIELKDQLDRIEAKLDENTRETIQNTSNLREHMRRTDLLEKAKDSLSERIRPIESHVSMLAGVFKAFVALGAAVGIAVSIYQLIGYLKG
jgi:hypothetical protein